VCIFSLAARPPRAILLNCIYGDKLMDLLKQIVKINENGLVADAVNFGMMTDAEKNLSLCKGFVFNHSAETPKSSTVGVLECVRRSFHSPSEPNVHLVVQDFGKGKSHFALVLANYFQRAADSPELEGIFHQVGLAVGPKQAVLEELVAHKRRSRPYLILALSGDAQTDLKQMLLREIRTRLAADGVTDSIAQRLCEPPLAYLKSLSGEKASKANQFLASRQMDVSSLIKLLEADRHQEISTVRDLSRELEQFAYDFNDLGIEEILQDLLNNLCTGKDSKYQGVLVLFDELYAYLQMWAGNPNAAGGMALQNVTNVCENNKSRIALVCLTQLRPSHVTALPTNSARDYKKLTSRLELGPSTYEPMSSLEFVIENLINANNQARWQDFVKTWRGTLQAESDAAYARCSLYQQRRWPSSEFFEHLGKGSFPLHPLTGYLLCNLDFMQGRTAIQFIKENVKHYIENEPTDKNGFLNFIRPVALVDAFESNFSNHNLFPDYQKALTKILASATDDDLRILKSLFLFYVSSAKLKKPDNEPHEQLLSALCGMTVEKTREGLERLTEQLGVIYHFTGTKTYRFYSGVGLDDLRRVIDEDVTGISRTLDDVAAYLQDHISQYFPADHIVPSQFVSESRQLGEDWKFKIRPFTAEKLREWLDRGSAEAGYRGMVAVLLSDLANDAQMNVIDFENELRTSALRSKVVIAVPKQGLSEVSDLIVKRRALDKKSTAERERYGEAYNQLRRMWDVEIESRIANALKECAICSPATERLPSFERGNLDAVCSALLAERFGYVPPVESVDKLRSGRSAGTQIITFMLKQLLLKSLSNQSLPTAAYKQVIESVFLRSWHLLRLSGTQYSAQVPTNTRVKAAWDAITASLPLTPGGENKIAGADLWKQFSQEPFGYNDLTFAALLGAWISVHRAELRIRILRRDPGQPVQYQELTIAQFIASPECEKIINFLQREDVFFVRREAVTDVQIPNRQTTAEARTTLDKIQEVMSGDLTSADFKQNLELVEKILRRQLADFDSWEVDCRTADVSNTLALPELTELFGRMQSPPDFSEKKLDVHLTPAQLEKQASRLENIRASIHARINACQQSARAVKDEADFRNIVAQIERDTEVLKRSPSLFAAFSPSLEDARRLANEQMNSLRDRAAYDRTVEGVKSVLRVLSKASSQSAVANAAQSIENYAKECPSYTTSREYRDAVRQVEQYRLSLSSWLTECKTRIEKVKTKNVAQNLLAEIKGSAEKYDSPEDAERLKELCRMLEDRAQELGCVENANRELNIYVAAIKASCERVSKARDPLAALGPYRELGEIKVGNIEGAANREQLVNEAERMKASAGQSIANSIRAICQQNLSTVSECDRLIAILTGVCEEIVPLSEFNDLSELAAEAIRIATSTKGRLEVKAQDESICSQLKILKTRNLNTLVQCESVRRELDELTAQLSQRDVYEGEVQDALRAISERREKLIAKLAAVNNMVKEVRNRSELAGARRNYDQLEAVVTGSEHEAEYRALEGELDARGQIISLVSELQSKASSAKGVTAWLEVSSEVEAKKAELPLWVHEDLTDLYKHMLSEVERSAKQLQNWTDQLQGVKTRSELLGIREALVPKSTIYAASSYEEEFRKLCNAVEKLERCISLESSSKDLTTERACRETLVELERIENQCTDSPGFVQARLIALRDLIQAKSDKIRRDTIESWEAWVGALNDQFDHLERISAPFERLSAISKMKSEIEQKRSSLPDFVPGEVLGSIDSVQNQLDTLANADKVAQIFTLFTQLAPDKKRLLISQLQAEIEVSENPSAEALYQES
jgi:hypothetical protein